MGTTHQPRPGLDAAAVAGGDTWPEPDAGGRLPRLLLPYDGTPRARAALELAGERTLARGGEAWVLYVRVWDTSRGGHYFVETREEACRVATEGVARLRERGVPASGLTRDADRSRVARTIIAEAVALQVGEVVLGAGRRGWWGSVVHGSVSRSVARLAHLPVIGVEDAGGSTSPLDRPSPPILASRRTHGDDR